MVGGATICLELVEINLFQDPMGKGAKLNSMAFDVDGWDWG